MRLESIGIPVERQIQSRLRTPQQVVSLFLPTAMVACLVAFISRPAGTASGFFILVLAVLWSAGSTLIREVVDDRPFMERDPDLSTLGYAVSKIGYAIFVSGVQAALFTLVLTVFGNSLLNPPKLWVILWLVSFSGGLIALIVSALWTTAVGALNWFPFFVLPQIVFAGFVFPYQIAQPFTIDSAADQWTIRLNSERRTPADIVLFRDSGQNAGRLSGTVQGEVTQGRLTGSISVKGGVGGIVDMPDGLKRRPAGPFLQALGPLFVSRWALEALAAATLEEDLNDRRRLEKAISVTGLVPVTLAEEPARLLRAHVVSMLESRPAIPPAPEFSGLVPKYLAIIVGFDLLKAIVLVVAVIVRDPRRR